MQRNGVLEVYSYSSNFFEILTWETSRGVPGTPHVAADPRAVPVPVLPATAPGQMEHTAVAARVAKDGAIEADVSPRLPTLRNERLIFPEDLKHSHVEADVTCFFQAAKIFFTRDPLFTRAKRRLEGNPVQVDLGESKGSLVLLIDRPTPANKGDGVERFAAVDLQQI